MLMADGHILPDFEVTADASSTDACAVSVMNDEAFPNFRTVDGACVLGRNEPGDELGCLAKTIINHRAIFPLTIKLNLRVEGMGTSREKVFQPIAFLRHEKGVTRMDPQKQPQREVIEHPYDIAQQKGSFGQ